MYCKFLKMVFIRSSRPYVFLGGRGLLVAGPPAPGVSPTAILGKIARSCVRMAGIENMKIVFGNQLILLE